MDESSRFRVDNDKEVKRVTQRCYTVNKMVIYFNEMLLLLRISHFLREFGIRGGVHGHSG